MSLKNLHLKLKGIRIRRFLIGNGKRKSRKPENDNKPSWMTHVTHGYHVVELDRAWRSGVKEFDSVVVQREQIQQSELWFFGVFDYAISEGITKYIQLHFFDKMPKQSRIMKLSKQAMKRAHLRARAQLTNRVKKPEVAAPPPGSASAMVMGGEKLVTASMGDFRVVICRDGEAIAMYMKQQSSLTQWSLKLIPGASRLSKASEANEKIPKTSEVVIGTHRIYSGTEFVILASSGVWEVMKDQEAVNLIRHIEDPKEAAECLATEALTRMSKSNISCLIIRFN